MAPSILSQPVTLLARSTYPLAIEDSLALASRRIRESGVGIIALIENGRYQGAITERSLGEALAAGFEPLDQATRAREKVELRIGPYSTGAEALRLFSELGVPALIVVDDAGYVLGTLSPSDLYPRQTAPPRPPMIGGMATPFGVYLTTGVVRAGASDLALVTTGMLLVCLLNAAAIGAGTLTLAMVDHGLRMDVADLLSSVIALGLFAIAMRILPLAGIHAAEHKVVHAIERGEELSLEVVRRMPRVHPRCGTNFAVGATLFLSLATTPFIPIDTVRLLVALVATLLLWRPLGSLVQRFVTTAPPNDRQLKMGIQAGEELLQKYVQAPVVMPGFFRRIYNSGILHVMLGGVICTLAELAVAKLLHIDIGL
jgi:hypothetical protein